MHHLPNEILWDVFQRIGAEDLLSLGMVFGNEKSLIEDVARYRMLHLSKEQDDIVQSPLNNCWLRTYLVFVEKHRRKPKCYLFVNSRAHSTRRVIKHISRYLDIIDQYVSIRVVKDYSRTTPSLLYRGKFIYGTEKIIRALTPPVNLPPDNTFDIWL